MIFGSSPSTGTLAASSEAQRGHQEVADLYVARKPVVGLLLHEQLGESTSLQGIYAWVIADIVIELLHEGLELGHNSFSLLNLIL